MPLLGKLSVYNSLVPGRQRLSFGYRPDRDYNLVTHHFDALFAAHEIARPKAANEFRVLLIGDSATWGYLLPPQHTLAATLNQQQLRSKDGRTMRVYNLGYPDFSLTKDALILQRALAHQFAFALVESECGGECEAVVGRAGDTIDDAAGRGSRALDGGDPRLDPQDHR